MFKILSSIFCHNFSACQYIGISEGWKGKLRRRKNQNPSHEGKLLCNQIFQTEMQGSLEREHEPASARAVLVSILVRRFSLTNINFWTSPAKWPASYSQVVSHSSKIFLLSLRQRLSFCFQTATETETLHIWFPDSNLLSALPWQQATVSSADRVFLSP